MSYMFYLSRNLIIVVVKPVTPEHLSPIVETPVFLTPLTLISIKTSTTAQLLVFDPDFPILGGVWLYKFI